MSDDIFDWVMGGLDDIREAQDCAHVADYYAEKTTDQILYARAWPASDITWHRLRRRADMYRWWSEG